MVGSGLRPLLPRVHENQLSEGCPHAPDGLEQTGSPELIPGPRIRSYDARPNWRAQCWLWHSPASMLVAGQLYIQRRPERLTAIPTSKEMHEARIIRDAEIDHAQNTIALQKDDE